MARLIKKLSPVVLAAVACCGTAGVAHGAAKTKLATCDEVPGEERLANDRWRVFVPVIRGEFDDVNQRVVACRRGLGPVRRIIGVDSGLDASPTRLAGDVVQIQGGRYDNSFRIAVDLSTGRSLTLSNDLNDRAKSQQLLGSGAIVSALGEPFGGDDDPASGMYVPAVDGSLQRIDASAATSSAAWALDPDHRSRKRTFLISHRTGERTTLVGNRYQLTERRARRGHRATLVLHAPSYETILRKDGYPDARSDVVGRLAPGSRADLEVLPECGIVARFADRPSERRLRIDGIVDQPAPAGQFRCVRNGRTGDFALVDPTGITLYAADPKLGKRVPQRIAVNGPTAVAVVSGYSDGTRTLLYSDAEGKATAVGYAK